MMQPSDLEPEIRTLFIPRQARTECGGGQSPIPSQIQSPHPDVHKGASLSEQRYIKGAFIKCRAPRREREVNGGVADEEPSIVGQLELATKAEPSSSHKSVVPASKEPVLAVSLA